MSEILNILDTLKYIEIETCSACTRTCQWCFFGNYKNRRPNANKFLETVYIKKIVDELDSINYHGTIALYSINEPLLDDRIRSGKLISHIKNRLGDKVKINIITNGDLLTLDMIKIMYMMGLDNLLISCYDDKGYNSALIFKENMDQITVLDQRRYRNGEWESNRAGTINSVHNKMPDDVNQYNSCYMPFFRVVIGWDGEIRICPHDIIGVKRIGNIKRNDLFDLLLSKEMNKFRYRLVNDRYNTEPCKSCNVDGSIRYMLEHMNDLNEVKSIVKALNSGFIVAE